MLIPLPRIGGGVEHRQRRPDGPAFEKLLIGPAMVFGELVTGGHYLEVLRLGKQMAPGRVTAPSYSDLHRGYLRASGDSLAAALYRGFFPWGLIQCGKGVPVLFAQHESMRYLRRDRAWSKSSAEKASGFIGGVAQALFVNPLQKVKVSVVACERTNSMGPLGALVHVVRRDGLPSLYDGILPMILRRSLDWGIRWSASSEARRFLEDRKRKNGEIEPNLSAPELVACGLVGGALSALTHPIDNVITNSQRPMPPGSRRDVISVVRQMYREGGHRAFTRAWGIKVLDNAYHMAWMYGIGTVIYEHARKAFSDDHQG